MSLAIFGISNGGLNLVVSLLVLGFFVVWLALIVYTYLDAKRRISDPFLVGCATLASFFPYIGTAVYAIVRPPEFLEDAHERELEIKAAELRVRQLTEQSCPNCEYPVEKNFLRCPNCQRRLKDPCPTCKKPVDPRWALCPYCETELQRRARRPQKREPGGPRKTPGVSPRKETERPIAKKEPATRAASPEASRPKRQQRSTAREPDPDPRQA
jgi:hypothetical protein